MAAMLFVVGAALGMAAPLETEDTRLSRADAGKFETGSHVKRLAQSLEVRPECAGVDEVHDLPVSTLDIPSHPSDSPAVTAWAMSHNSAGLTPPRVRDGDSRAPPSA
jgi:hypothetical protein